MLLDFDKLIKKYNLKITGILHIGGHYGQEFKIYEKNGIKDIIFFEPVPSTFDILKKNLEGKAILVNVALGNENKKVEMNIETFNLGQSNSILSPELHLIQYPDIRFNDKIEVEMIRLDDFISNLYSDIFSVNSLKYNFINIDVQGYELEVFKGGKKTLENIHYIMTEVNRDEVYVNCAKIGDLDKYLGKYDFRRVETTWDGHTWGDAFYVKGIGKQTKFSRIIRWIRSHIFDHLKK